MRYRNKTSNPIQYVRTVAPNEVIDVSQAELDALPAGLPEGLLRLPDASTGQVHRAPTRPADPPVPSQPPGPFAPPSLTSSLVGQTRKE